MYFITVIRGATNGSKQTESFYLQVLLENEKSSKILTILVCEDDATGSLNSKIKCIIIDGSGL